ncbi:ATP-binding protein [Parashewanella spongiae]|uniref:ATP-binding protein n=1 Tax=Parashewanella spongiae TaxID=342950 RepID=A0A3A6U9A5_9GAMM|nr:ATP-binding protein [Parashewanella spongiae]MCL1076702.1 ATP-binding protein [Parashewanella spongiae]RJY18511.1 ATP-binding protein [Parashewanella spongiae]
MPSLIRIVLIDTHLPGVVELELDGHTNICGTNASGKTTLQRLVPVFYGEYPSRVVPSTRDSFERWYLPHDGSYIIYEYRKSDGLIYQAVLSSAGDGKGVNYRFIAKAFELDDFVKTRHGDNIICHTTAELGRQFKRDGVLVSKHLNTREYRAVIQHDRSLLNIGSSRSELRGYANQFSLCDSEHSLRHIEKLAKAVHSKEGKMETIKSMIAAILEEDGVNPPSSRVNPQHVEAWINESQLVKGFEQLQPEYVKLEQEFNQLLSVEHRLSSLTRVYKNDEELEIQRKELAENKAKEECIKLKMLEENWKETRDELNQELSAAKADSSKYEQELDLMEEQHGAFLDADIEQAKIDLTLIPNWQTDLENMRERHKLQTEKHHDVESAYNERRSKISEKLNRDLEKLHTQLETQREQKEQQRDTARKDIETLNDKAREQIASINAEHNEQRSEFKLKAAEYNIQLQNVTYTQAEKHTLAEFDARINLGREQEQSSSHKVDRLTTEERKLRAKREQANETLRSASKRVIQRQQQLDEVEQALYPQSHTLLEFLRKEADGWEQNVGKVIAPELLHRTDLHPQVATEVHDSLFGIHLDLKAVEVPECAETEQALRIRFNKAEEAVELAKEQQQIAEAQLVEVNTQLDDLSRELTIARTAYRNCRDDLQRLWEDKTTAQEKIDQALKSRQSDTQQLLVKLESELKRQAQQHQTRVEEHQAQARDDKMERQAYWQEVIGVIDNQINQTRNSIDQRKTNAKVEQKECDVWYKDELQSRGVDEGKIVKLKQDINNYETRISNAESRRNDVLKFDDWYQREWIIRKPKLQTMLTEVKQAVAEFSQRLSTESSKVKTQRETIDKTRKQQEAIQVETSENLTRLRELIRKLSDLKLPANDDEVQGGLAERMRQGSDSLLMRENLLSSIKQYVEHFDSIIASKSGSRFAEMWEKSREESSSVNDKGIRILDYRKLVPELDNLLNVIVSQQFRAIQEQGRIFGVDLTAYYDVLADIDRRIASQSARITREVGEELFLDGVSESAVKIRSRISELEFWPELERFVKAFATWKASGFDGLPDEDYIISMRRVLDIIGRSALAGGISKLLEIELRLREGHSDLVIRTDRQLNESSSHGMAYLILCKFLLAFTRLLRGRAQVTIHWPIDELGTLHHNNVKKIFDACENNQISVLGAFPNPESEVLTLFKNRYIIDKKTKKLQVVKPKVNPIAEKLKNRLKESA